MSYPRFDTWYWYLFNRLRGRCFKFKGAFCHSCGCCNCGFGGKQLIAAWFPWKTKNEIKKLWGLHCVSCKSITGFNSLESLKEHIEKMSYGYWTDSEFREALVFCNKCIDRHEKVILEKRSKFTEAENRDRWHKRIKYLGNLYL